MYSPREDVQYKRGYAIRVSHIISTSEDPQYNQGRSSSCGTGRGGGTTQRYFSMNESLFLLMYQVKAVSRLW